MSDDRPSKIHTVAVIGAGAMGHGIAQVAAMAGWHVALQDLDGEALNRAFERIRANLTKGVERGKVESAIRDRALDLIHTTTALARAVADADLVIEAVPEDLDLKQSIFAEIDARARPGAMLATNTSSLRVGRIAGAVRDPGRVVGMHFFNPVHIMRLVEIVRADRTSQETVDRALEAARRMGKNPIVVQDSPGFASSRLGVTLGLEAMRMVEEGVASPADIDTAMTLGYNHPMGPLELTDLVGLDVRLAVAEYLYRETGSDRFRPPEILRRMVAEGKLGKKSGQGFYRWDPEGRRTEPTIP